MVLAAQKMRVGSGPVPVNELYPNGSRVPQCLYSKGPLYLFGNASVESLVPWLSAYVTSRGFNGIYFDQFYYSPTLADEESGA